MQSCLGMTTNVLSFLVGATFTVFTDLLQHNGRKGSLLEEIAR